MSRPVAWLVALAMLVGAWFVAWATPDGEERISDPFRVAAEVGAPAAGDNLGVTVTALTLADRVTSGGWYATGTWLVVDLEAWVTRTESPGSLNAVFLVVGDRVFRASERPGAYDPEATLLRTGLHLDRSLSGSIAFELPEELPDEPATLQLAIGNNAISHDDVLEADSVIELTVDLHALERIPELALPPTEWTIP